MPQAEITTNIILHECSLILAECIRGKYSPDAQTGICLAPPSYALGLLMNARDKLRLLIIEVSPGGVRLSKWSFFGCVFKMCFSKKGGVLLSIVLKLSIDSIEVCLSDIISLLVSEPLSALSLKKTKTRCYYNPSLDA